MILPAPRLLWLLGAWLALALAASVSPALAPFWRSGSFALALLAALDALAVLLTRAPTVSRRVSESLPLAVWSAVELTFRHRHGLGRVTVFDHLPPDFTSTGLPAALAVPRDREQVLSYRVRPLARGDHAFGAVELRLQTALALWQRRVYVPAAQSVRVYPNFAAFTRHALLAADAFTSGVLKRRRRGEGLEFEQLREYREGDTLRQIDWKATRRIGKLISREYRDERDQRIVLLADCGRRMGARDAELSHFDHVLDALLLLAYVGLRQGDAVGLMTLGVRENYLEPQKSRAMVKRILHAVYDLQPTLDVTDFEASAVALMQRLRRRALVVLFTNLRDEDDIGLLTAARLLSSRHLVLVASLRERVLDEAQATSVDGVEAAALRAAATEYRQLREATLARLRQAGILCLDVAPQELAVATVNRYLAIKAEGRL